MQTTDNNIKILVIPDVHGRSFWREPVNYVLENTDAKIVFLGDFTDPYKIDFKEGENYKEIAISVFEEIINLKKENSDRIILLIGNHDGTYRYGPEICECRTDYANYDKIRNLFIENKDLFQLAYEETINDKHFIFSHAGIHKGYVKAAFPYEFEHINETNVVEWFNDAYRAEDQTIINSLGMYDQYRGWGGYDYGSLVWADIHSWLHRLSDEEEYDVYQIFGHTQMEHGSGGFFANTFACLDSAEAFIINDLGKIEQFKK